ncbi:MAG: zinc-binding dehydrogenase [Actinobacteria bacterium]|nr:MAG: zinc-binding dehydrogenase [Actinomycetota bacterium]
MMKAILLPRFGDPDVLEFADVPCPEPGPGQVRIRVHAVVVARTKDVALRSGRHPFARAVTLPHVPGTEHAGTVDATGAGVDPGLVGRPVAVSAVLPCGTCRACGRGRDEACPDLRLLGVHRPGGYAQFCVAPAANVVPVPDGVPFPHAAALAANGPVARAQLDAGAVGAGTTVLVLGASGALGSTVAALARFRGARVIATARLGARPDCLADVPAQARLDIDRPDLAEAVLDLTGGWGADCVVDNLGLPRLWPRYQPALAATGRVVVSGALEETPVPVGFRPLYLRNHAIIGVRTGNRADIAGLWADVRAGFRLVPALVSTMPLAQAAAAHRTVEAGRHRGQIVLVP